MSKSIRLAIAENMTPAMLSASEVQAADTIDVQVAKIMQAYNCLLISNNARMPLRCCRRSYCVVTEDEFIDFACALVRTCAPEWSLQLIQYDTLTVAAVKKLTESTALTLKLLYVSGTVEVTVTYSDFTTHFDMRELVRESATPNSANAVTKLLMRCLAGIDQQGTYLSSLQHK